MVLYIVSDRGIDSAHTVTLEELMERAQAHRDTYLKAITDTGLRPDHHTYPTAHTLRAWWPLAVSPEFA